MPKPETEPPKSVSGGICYLVGAGPGDPGLVTLRAKELLGQADVVVYDSLTQPALLGWAPPDAERIFAGKSPGHHRLPQEEINRLLVERARAGLKVVRLKGGDPFLFGRGGEEAEALADAGIRFEVVPGISSTMAGPAYAGIPLTHREHASQVTLFTGHEDPEKGDSTLDYAQLAATPGTKVMLMGVARLAKIAGELLKHGADPAMPCALVQWATTGKQRVVSGPLSEIAARVREAGLEAPAVAVFGPVAALHERLDWFGRRPLLGRRILVTRARAQAGELVGRLRDLGADVIELPVIRIEPPPDLMAFAESVRDAHTYDWLVFGSANGAEAFFELFFRIYRDAREIGGARIAAIGPGTAARVQRYRFAVDAQPEKSVAEALLRTLVEQGSVENLKFLVVRAEQGRDILAKRLGELGAIVDEAVAYRTGPETADPAGGAKRLAEEGADLAVFTSGSTVTNFFALGLPWPEGMAAASIGPITSAALREQGRTVDIEAPEHDLDGLVAAIQRYLGRPN